MTRPQEDSNNALQIAQLTAPPPFLSAVEHDAATSATPSSFADIPPRLVAALDGVRTIAEPAGGPDDKIQSHESGQLWLTEQSLSFLPSTSGPSGFSLPYPFIVLHAVSSTLPGSSDPRKCIYCQIETSPGADEADDEEDDADALKELWIIPETDEQTEDIFQALSHCASLHPSLPSRDGEGVDGHPFSGFGPFGSGLPAGAEDGQYDDGEGELITDAAAQNGLSETGRAQLARLDALLDSNEDDDNGEDTAGAPQGSPTAANIPASHPGDVSPSNSNLILLSTYPHPYPALFATPLLPSLLALLDAYAPVVGWDPLPEKGSMRVVFDNRSGGSEARDCDVGRVKRVLDGLKLETLADEREQFNTDHGDIVEPHLQVEILPQSVDVDVLLPRSLSGALPRIEGQTEPDWSSQQTQQSVGGPGSSLFRPTNHLLPPTTDRNFLISPPGSPPIGWEPIKEDPPNRETLAGDLIEALKRLATARADEEETRDQHQDLSLMSSTQNESASLANSSSQDHSTTRHKHSRTQSRKIVLLAPAEIASPLQTDQGSTSQPATNPSLMVPGVTVESFGDDADVDDDVRAAPAAHQAATMDINRVKATVESMRGEENQFDTGTMSLGVKRITPTGRPPLA